jgi:hypothetical protein
MLNGKKHKLKHAFSSNSEDALTWTCFDIIRQLPYRKMVYVLDEFMKDAFDGLSPVSFQNKKNITVDIGRRYTVDINGISETSEMDASIETEKEIIFTEEKLYSSIHLKDDKHNYDQIIQKIRIGLKYAQEQGEKTFYFIVMDIAPYEKYPYYRKKKKQ